MQQQQLCIVLMTFSSLNSKEVHVWCQGSHYKFHIGGPGVEFDPCISEAPVGHLCRDVWRRDQVSGRTRGPGVKFPLIREGSFDALLNFKQRGRRGYARASAVVQNVHKEEHFAILIGKTLEMLHDIFIIQSSSICFFF